MEKIVDYDNTVMYRFQCDCLSPQDAMDVEIRKDIPNDVTIYFQAVPHRLSLRLEWCWKMLRTGVGFEHDIVLREKDVQDLARILIESGNEGV